MFLHNTSVGTVRARAHTHTHTHTHTHFVIVMPSLLTRMLGILCNLLSDLRVILLDHSVKQEASHVHIHP